MLVGAAGLAGAVQAPVGQRGIGADGGGVVVAAGGYTCLMKTWLDDNPNPWQ
jgi:hypothetical protein